MRKKTQFLLNLVLTLVFLVLIVFQGPNLNPMYPDGAFSWCFIISCYVILNFFVALGSVRITTNEYNRPQLSVDKSVGGYKTGFAPGSYTHLYGVGLDQVIAFGDGCNDMDMLRAVKNSYAMANAPLVVRRSAAHVTLDNDHQGLLAALEENFK